jgi:hypothetical protein
VLSPEGVGPVGPGGMAAMSGRAVTGVSHRPNKTEINRVRQGVLTVGQQHR